MKLQRLRVEQLRQFRQPVEIDALEDGITLFTGPNESGKSTLVQAIRAAFFERYKSGSVDDLQPWGDSSAAPEITLEFHWQGEQWRLAKRFLKKPRCDLQVGSQSFSGDDAEERLAELLGFQFPGRGASKPEHWGIPGLLWIEQGAGQEVQQAVTYAGDHLKSALGSTLGEVASTGGDELIACLESDRAKLLTGTGRPTGEYKAAQEKQESLASALANTSQQIADYAQLVDRLAELRDQQRQDRDKPWVDYRNQAAEAENRLWEVAAWQRDQAREQQELTACRDSQELFRRQLQGFANQQADLEERRAAHQRAVADQERLREQSDAIRTHTEKAKSVYENAREQVRLAQQKELGDRLRRDLEQLDTRLADDARRLEQAKVLLEGLGRQREALQANSVDGADLKRLQQAVRQQQDLAIEERAAATRVQFHLQPGKALALNGESLEGQGERLLLEAATLDIPGTGQLRILPGGQDLAELARKRGQLADRIDGLLNTLRVASLEEAEERAETCRRLGEEIASAEKTLDILAPLGVDTLAQSVALDTKRREELRQQQGQLPALADDQPTLPVAEAELEIANTELQQAETAAARHASDIQLAEQAVRTAETERDKLSRAIEAPERQQQQAEANRQLIDLQARESALQQSIAAREAQISAANPDILQQDIDRFTRTANELERVASEREREILTLESKLDTMGALGLEETRAEQALAVEQSERRCAEFSRRAAALDLLLAMLREKRQALTRRLHAPLQRHLNHYLQLLFPGAQLEMDDDLVPQRLLRGGTSADVTALDALSFGAREQMGLISRLAYADMLREADRPTLIILDDALVHSDSQRLAQMKRILFDAATRHQILLFTCHPENWRDLGVAPRDMQALKLAVPS
ncbi:MAG: AAA family ATPase [Rhodocyclaceae bacterium]|jgi:chromosome segregation ATPase|nr:AAA family ATPase [Rhodocyclaceae bacterium]